MIRQEGGQGSSVDQAQVKVREVVTCHRVFRPKDYSDGFSSWPTSTGQWNWQGNAVAVNGGIANGDPRPPSWNPSDMTDSPEWCLGRPITYTQIRTRTSGLQHAKVRGGMTWNKRWAITGTSGTEWWLGIPTWQEYEAEMMAGEAHTLPYTGSRGLVLSDVDQVVYKVDPDAGYYTGWEAMGNWFGGYPTVYWLKRVFPGRGHSSQYGSWIDGGGQLEYRFLKTQFEIPPYELPPGVGPTTSATFSNTNRNAKRYCTWWVMPRIRMLPREGVPMPDPLTSNWEYPAGDSDAIELQVLHDTYREHSNRPWGTLRAETVQESNASTISHDASTFEWDGTAGDLPSMGSYAYNIRAGLWPGNNTSNGGTGPSVMEGRLRLGDGYSLSGYPGAQKWWPQVRPEKTGSPYEWPANISNSTNYLFRSTQVAPKWQGVPTSGPEAFIPSQYDDWVVDDCTIGGIQFEVCTSRPHLHIEYVVGNWG
tara:strand:+ start:11606 stop:13039 length:1434 start_codon:yes stop_codon:yes gene_type:complete